MDDPENRRLLLDHKCRHGSLLFFTHDRFIGRALQVYGEYSEIELQVLLQLCRPGDTVIEAGANIGCHTVPMARHVANGGRVVAFEPQRILFQVMCANVALNGLWNVLARQEGLGGIPGVMSVPVVDYSQPGNFGGIQLGLNSGEQVMVQTIDALEMVPALVKIDVEGMELDVLAGAARTIARCRPIFYLENDRPRKSAELIGHLFQLGYDLWWHVPPLFNPENHKGVAENLWPNFVSANMIAIPKERAAIVTGCNRVTDTGETSERLHSTPGPITVSF